MSDLMADLRALNDERDRKLRGWAEDDCPICDGRGQGPSSRLLPGAKAAGTSPCCCTGFAAYQAGPCPEIPEPFAQTEPVGEVSNPDSVSSVVVAPDLRDEEKEESNG